MIAAAMMLSAIPAGAAGGMIMTPESDDQVIAVLPASNRDVTLRHLARQPTITTSPDQLLSAARRHIALARRHGDPRELGRARALLQRDGIKHSTPGRLALASIRQSEHDFTGARALLDQVLRSDPQNTAALLMLSNINRVQGDLAAALTACRRAYAIRRDAMFAVCAADVAALTGDTAQASQWLTLAGTSRHRDRTSGWVALVLAEMAVRAGDHRKAARHYQQAMADPEIDVYHLDSYARWLIQRGNAQDAIKVLTDTMTPDALPDALLVRLAIAHHVLNDDSTASALARQLHQRFALTPMTGLNRHLRERAEYQLHFGSAQLATDLARQNWASQREPTDALLLAQAARASDSQRDLNMLRTFVRDSGWRDTRLDTLLGAHQ